MYHNNPLFTQLTRLFQNYSLVKQLFSHIIIPLVPIEAAETFDPPLFLAHFTILLQ